MKSKNELKANHNPSFLNNAAIELANMKSKNELKANHNNYRCSLRPGLVGKYEVKERIESKSQLNVPGKLDEDVGKYEVKERIESKSQPQGASATV